MIENFQSELIWKSIRKCSYIVDGLRRAGFRDGWLNDTDSKRASCPSNPK